MNAIPTSEHYTRTYDGPGFTNRTITFKMPYAMRAARALQTLGIVEGVMSHATGGAFTLIPTSAPSPVAGVWPPLSSTIPLPYVLYEYAGDIVSGNAPIDPKGAASCYEAYSAILTVIVDYL